MNEQDFASFLTAVRSGDRTAAADLVRRYEPYLRQVIRLRLTDERLRRVFDSADICQSVLANFFARAAAGAFDVPGPEGLRALLARMAINKLLDKVRQEQHHGGGIPDGWDAPANDPTPSQVLLRADLAAALRARLTERECWLFDQRAGGRAWRDIAAEVGAAPDALRVHLARAIARVQKEVQPEDSSDG
ncbi:MAG TPA: ECF-type sigma factor [Gemmataceae bacterium]|nr:ECF-type sigma factor [Gemmataceae bacterium]